MRLPPPSREQAGHSLFLGASGSGKTTLLVLALVSEMAATWARGEDTSYVLVDPKNDAAELLSQAMAYSGFSDRLTVLDPFVGDGFPLNLSRSPSELSAEVRAWQLAEILLAASTQAGQRAGLGTGARQLDATQLGLAALLDCGHDDATPSWLLDALTQRNGIERLSAITQADLRSLADMSDDLKASCRSRLRLGLEITPAVGRMWRTPSCVSFRDLMGPGRVLIVRLGTPPGGMEAISRMYAQLVLRQIFDELISRPSPWGGCHTRVVIDEFQVLTTVLAQSAETVLATGRSRGISLVAATQSLAPIRHASPSLLPLVLSNINRIIVGRLSAEDAALLSRTLTKQPFVDETTASLRAKFEASVASMRDRQFKLLGPGSQVGFSSLNAPLDRWQATPTPASNPYPVPPPRFPRLSDVHSEPDEGPPTPPRSPWGR